MKFPKIPRLSREIIITEKIDGTNGQIWIPGEEDRTAHQFRITADLQIMIGENRNVPFLCGSRSRWILPENDNHGFARWAMEHRDELRQLGPGRHFGEWWGQGIQRGYGLKEKRFSLFNTHRWGDPLIRPACCHVVPEIDRGNFTTDRIEQALDSLQRNGSYASPGYTNPEGIVVFHVAGNILFKKTIGKDDEPKSITRGK